MFDETVNGPLGTITEDSKYRYYSQVHSNSLSSLLLFPHSPLTRKQTKILATVATLLAVERGLLRLDDPVEMYIPEFADMEVYVSGTVAADDIVTEPAASPPTVRQCLMHTAGLAYERMA